MWDMPQYKNNGNLFTTTSAISEPIRCSSTCKHRLLNGVQEQAANSCQQLSHTVWFADGSLAKLCLDQIGMIPYLCLDAS